MIKYCRACEGTGIIECDGAECPAPPTPTTTSPAPTRSAPMAVRKSSRPASRMLTWDNLALQQHGWQDIEDPS